MGPIKGYYPRALTVNDPRVSPRNAFDGSAQNGAPVAAERPTRRGEPTARRERTIASAPKAARQRTSTGKEFAMPSWKGGATKIERLWPLTLFALA